MAGGTLVRRINSASQAKYGINILDVDQPTGVQGVGETTVGVVGDFPWGPTDEVTDVATVGDLFATFCPIEFGVADDYDAMKAFLNKTFTGGLKIVRIAATGAARASKTFKDDDSPTPQDSVTVSAKYKGAVGNAIRVAWSAGSSGSKRTATVTIGSTYEAVYEDIIDGTTLTDPGDPFVTFAMAVGADEPPVAIAATALTGGDDGTAVAGDYTGTAPTYTGIRAFYPADQKIGVLFVAEPPEALKDDINSGLESFATDTRKGMVLLCTVDGQSYSDAEDYAANYTDSDARIIYPYPRVETVDSYDPNRAVIETDGASWYAAAIVSVDPEVSPGGAGGLKALAGITGVESSFEDAVYAELNAAGVGPFFMSSELDGCIIRNALTTNLTKGKTKVFRRRFADFLEDSIGEFLALYQERPLDVQLNPPVLGPVTDAEINGIVSFLEGLKGANRLAAYSVDPFGANTQDDLDDDRWTIAVYAKMFGSQDELLVQMNAGPNVTIPVATS